MPSIGDIASFQHIDGIIPPVRIPYLQMQTGYGITEAASGCTAHYIRIDTRLRIVRTIPRIFFTATDRVVHIALMRRNPSSYLHLHTVHVHAVAIGQFGRMANLICTIVLIHNGDRRIARRGITLDDASVSKVPEHRINFAVRFIRHHLIRRYVTHALEHHCVHTGFMDSSREISFWQTRFRSGIDRDVAGSITRCTKHTLIQLVVRLHFYRPIRGERSAYTTGIIVQLIPLILETIRSGERIG